MTFKYEIVAKGGIPTWNKNQRMSFKILFMKEM